ncbi:type I restriction endonuclease subunit S [Lactobacillus nasalidis]|uniref:Type I restriction endonuclease subunit S n=1 Tax=Lactobacillus nasalidis TaxID=2797258 RepID=A0ABQ3W5U0_9LACO|nr:restriction endonuclease subunit S [Lactobacillus nasalidis]GHW01393.1 type I restriction endonuclease subunit S [Lactobacillus nasalidis]
MKTNLNVDTKALREKILDLAMRGKLVEQDPGDEPASVLLEKIQAKKAELVKEGKIKKSKKLPEISGDEKPFDIPDSWEWVRLNFGVIVERGGSPRPIKNFLTDSEEGINWIKIGDTKKNSKYITSTREKIIRDGLEKSREVHVGDFLLSNSMSFGRPYILKINGAIHDGWLVLSIIGNAVESNFLYYLICSPSVQRFFKNAATGTTVKNLNKERVSITPIPLPPLAEQKRIATKVSELFKLIDVIEKNVAEFQDLEQAMRSKLLDLAMQGKLVEQDPSDEPASKLLEKIKAEKAELVKEGKIKKGKKLPEITDDEKPFAIPDSWSWVRLGDVGDWGAGATPSKSNHEYYNGGTIPWILTGDLNDAHITVANQHITEKALKETSVKIKPVGSVLLAMYGATIGKLGILDIEATTNQACCACVPFTGVSNKYLFDYLMFMKPKFIKSGVGGAQPNISRTKIVATPIPLPPLAEQKRIVAKLTELFEQLDTIKQNLMSV